MQRTSIVNESELKTSQHGLSRLFYEQCFLMFLSYY